MKSNINVLSNIYPLKDTQASRDDDFIKQIRCGRALEVLVKERTGGADKRSREAMLRREGFPKSLIDLLEKDSYCVNLKDISGLEYPYGLVLKNGVSVVECRCLYLECPLYEDCTKG